MVNIAEVNYNILISSQQLMKELKPDSQFSRRIMDSVGHVVKNADFTQYNPRIFRLFLANKGERLLPFINNLSQYVFE